jgi:hypothetical protein
MVLRARTAFVVKDHGAQALAYVCYEQEAGRRDLALPITDGVSAVCAWATRSVGSLPSG